MSHDVTSARLRRIEDRLEIEELVNRYCMAVDDHDFEAMRGLLAVNSALDGSRGSGTRQVLADLQASMQRITSSVHTPEFVVLDELGDDTAQARSVRTWSWCSAASSSSGTCATWTPTSVKPGDGDSPVGPSASCTSRRGPNSPR